MNKVYVTNPKVNILYKIVSCFLLLTLLTQ